MVEEKEEQEGSERGAAGESWGRKGNSGDARGHCSAKDGAAGTPTTATADTRGPVQTTSHRE